jgi:peroxiredoxin Q/BCP
MAHLDVGDPAPDFELGATSGGTYRLSEHRGRWVILAFYPGDFTAVCTKQFCSYRDAGERLDGLDADVIGISAQDLDSHQRFTAEHGLTVPLLADPDRKVGKAYGVVAPGGLVRRSIFVVDPDGVVRYRHVALIGLRYKTADELGDELAKARAAYAAA